MGHSRCPVPKREPPISCIVPLAARRGSLDLIVCIAAGSAALAAWFHNWLQRAARLRLMRGPNRFQKTLRSREREVFPILGALEPDGFAFRAVACLRQGAACIGLKRNVVGLGSGGQSGMRAPYTPAE